MIKLQTRTFTTRMISCSKRLLWLKKRSLSSLSIFSRKNCLNSLTWKNWSWIQITTSRKIWKNILPMLYIAPNSMGVILHWCFFLSIKRLFQRHFFFNYWVTCILFGKKIFKKNDHFQLLSRLSFIKISGNTLENRGIIYFQIYPKNWNPTFPILILFSHK